MRTTIESIAKAAGVSTATVDRVLNGRNGVRERTRTVVLEVAQKLGYVGDPGEGQPGSIETSDQVIKLAFVLPVGTNQFVNVLQSQIESQSKARHNIDVNIVSLDGINPKQLAEKLRFLEGKTDGIGVIALDHPEVREAIRILSASGIKVVTLASDILHVPRVAYIGIDNRAAGRLAGYLVRRFHGHNAEGKVALFSGSLSYRGHEEREMGFRHILNEESPKLRIVEQLEMFDDLERAYGEAMQLLERHPDLAAIYNVGAGNSGIARALQESNLSRHVIFIGHEATSDTKKLLLEGTLDAVIDQNPRVEAREALNALECAITGKYFESHAPRLQVVFKENIPEI